MGATISRLLSRRKDLTTYSAQLKSLDENIRLLEAERVGRYNAHRRIARGLILYASAVALLLFAVSVLTLEHSTTALIIVAYGLVVFAVKWAVDVFFAYTIESAATQLAALESNKVAMINELMELTDFKQTAQLIQTYSKRTPPPPPLPPPPSSSSSSSPSKGPPPPLLRAATMLPSSMSASKAPLPQRPQPVPPSVPSQPAVSASAVRVVGCADDVSHPTTRRSAVDKVIDFILNDGVNNRFALICSYCYTHNGLVREDELGKRFRCAQCNFINGPPLPPDWKPPTPAVTPATTPPITPSATAKHDTQDNDVDHNIFFTVNTQHKTHTPALSPPPSPPPPPPPSPPPPPPPPVAAVDVDRSVGGSSVSDVTTVDSDVVTSGESSGASSSDGVRRRPRSADRLSSSSS